MKLSKNDRVQTMTSAVSMAREAANILIGRVEQRTHSRMIAYGYIASRVGRSTSWVRQLIGNRLRRIDSDVKSAIDVLLIRELEAELGRLTHELEMARQIGMHPTSHLVDEVETYLAGVKTLLENYRK